MKIASTTLVLICLSFGVLFGQDRRASPIVILVQRESPLCPKVNNEIMRIPDMVKFLAHSANVFGRQEPMIIRLENNGDIAVAATLAHIAGKTHDSIAIEIAATDNGSVVYILPIAKEGVGTKIDPSKPKGSSSLPIDINPNRVIDDQYRRLQEDVK